MLKEELKGNVKLKVKAGKETMGIDSELEVLFVGEENIIVRTLEGKECPTDLKTLDALYEIIPSVTPTKENFLDRLKEDLDLMIMYLSAFTQTKAVSVDQNILNLGSKLHGIKEEVTTYVSVESTEDLSDTEKVLRKVAA